MQLQKCMVSPLRINHSLSHTISLIHSSECEHCIHTLAKNDLDIIWYESKLEVGWHLGFLFVEWGGLRGVMG